MKNFVIALLVGVFAVSANAVTLPVASPTSATIPWSLPSNCSGTNTCQFQVYRCSGSCTVADTNWNLIATTAVQATSYKDTTVAGGTQYTYDVEAVPTGSATVFSGPSNVGAITVLFTPLPPVIGIIATP